MAGRVDLEVVEFFLESILNLRPGWEIDELVRHAVVFKAEPRGYDIEIFVTLTYYGVATLTVPVRDNLDEVIIKSSVFEKILEAKLKQWFGVEPDIKIGTRRVNISLPLEAVRKFSPSSKDTDWALEIADFVYEVLDKIKDRLVREVSKELVDALGILDEL